MLQNTTPDPTDYDDAKTDCVRQRTVCALRARKLKPRGPASVFDLAERPAGLRRPLSAGGRRDTAQVIERAPGVTRCRRIPASETPDRMEQERQRRARQTVPRPGYKILSRLRQWGNDGKAAAALLRATA